MGYTDFGDKGKGGSLSQMKAEAYGIGSHDAWTLTVGLTFLFFVMMLLFYNSLSRNQVFGSITPELRFPATPAS